MLDAGRDAERSGDSPSSFPHAVAGGLLSPLFSTMRGVASVGGEWRSGGERVTRADSPSGETQYVCHQRPGIFTR